MVISGYSTPIVINQSRDQNRSSFRSLSAFGLLVADGKRIWWVRGLACEMKSIASYDSEYLYIMAGLSYESTGPASGDHLIRRGLKKYDKNNDGQVGKLKFPGPRQWTDAGRRL